MQHVCIIFLVFTLLYQKIYLQKIKVNDLDFLAFCVHWFLPKSEQAIWEEATLFTCVTCEPFGLLVVVTHYDSIVYISDEVNFY